MIGMAYDRDSFLAGVAVGRNMKSWPDMHGYGKGFFAFTIKTVAASFTYQFGIYFGGTIDWGDGTSEDYAYNNFRDRISHVYATAGVYQVRITGYMNVIRLGTTNGTTPTTPTASAARLISVDTPFPRLSSPAAEATYAYLDYCFANCTNLKSIPKNLFANYKAQGLVVRGMRSMFDYCSSLKTIPQGLFKDLAFDTPNQDSRQPISMFRGCSSIEEFPGDLLDNPVFASVTNVTSMFHKCTALKHIPVEKLPFAAATNFQWLFRECQSLEEIPDGLLDNCTQAHIFDYAFCHCDSLTTIPDGLFDNCSNITQIEFVFWQAGIENIPHELFKNKHSLVSAIYAFSGTAVHDIPGDIFDGCDALTSASYCFSSCRSLTEVPGGLFNGCTALNSIASCFYWSGIETIASDLCYGCTALTNVNSCFSGCQSLTDIPTQLFSTCTAITNINYCFQGCTALDEVLSGTFAVNIAITKAEYVFAGCSSLTTVGSSVFMQNYNLTSLRAAFNDCSAITSAVPELWTVHQGSGFDKAACFYGCNNAANYADIPASWGGPG